MGGTLLAFLFAWENLFLAPVFVPLEPPDFTFDPDRLARALEHGATEAIDSSQVDAGERVDLLTGGQGVDLAIEAVGIPETFELCTEIVRSGGHVANVGVHGKPATLHLEKLWIRDVTAPVRTAPHDAEPEPAPARLPVVFVLGVYFGIVLVKSEAVSWFRIQEMFRFGGFHMYGILGSAVLVAGVSLAMVSSTASSASSAAARSR